MIYTFRLCKDRQKKLNRTDLGKCTHQCHETRGNNSTRALSTKIVFFMCKKIDKTNVYYCFLVFRAFGEYSSLDLF